MTGSDLSGRAGRAELSAIAQLGERQTEDLKVPDSISGGGMFLVCTIFFIFCGEDGDAVGLTVMVHHECMAVGLEV